MGGDRGAETGEVDGRDAAPPRGAGARRRGSRVRLPRGACTSSPQLDSGGRPRVGLPARARAAATVAALPAVQPSLPDGVRTAALRAPAPSAPLAASACSVTDD